METSTPSQPHDPTEPPRPEGADTDVQGEKEPENRLVVSEVVKLYICTIVPIVVLFTLPIYESAPIRRVSIAMPMIGLTVALRMAMDARSRGPVWWWWLGGSLAAQMVGLFYIFLNSW